MTDPDFRLAHCRSVLGFLQSDELPTVAVTALENGLNSPALRELAGLTQADVGEARVLFDLALEQIGGAKPGEREAALMLARKHARAILDMELDAYRGAKKIWDISKRVAKDNVPELDPSSMQLASGKIESRIGLCLRTASVLRRRTCAGIDRRRTFRGELGRQ